MASSEKTQGFNLSQFQPDDKPTFLGDYNSDMDKIDQALNMHLAMINTAIATANNANSNVQRAIDLAESFDQRIIDVENAVDVMPGNLTRAYQEADRALKEGYETADKALSDRITNNTNKFGNYYTKEQADGLFQRNVDDRARVVIIGDDNSVANNTWVEDLGDSRGWVYYNYATAGAGYSVGGDNSYSSQLSKAITDTRFANDEISTVLIVSCWNDAVAKYNVTSLSEALFGQAARSFPNARVIVIPLLWRNLRGSLFQYDLQMSKLNRIQEIKKTALAAGIDLVDYAHTWFENEDTDSNNVVQPSYYAHVVTWLNRYLDGSGTANDGDRKFTDVAGGWAANDLSNGRCGLTLSRRGDVVTVSGTVSRTSGDFVNITRGTTFAGLPGFQECYLIDLFVTANTNHGSGIPTSFFIERASLKVGEDITGVRELNFNGSYIVG